MKRIDLEKLISGPKYTSGMVTISKGINEIMDFLEKNVPVRNGKIFHCLNCGHNTGYPGDLDCCSEPNWMVIK